MCSEAYKLAVRAHIVADSFTFAIICAISLRLRTLLSADANLALIRFVCPNDYRLDFF